MPSKAKITTKRSKDIRNIYERYTKDNPTLKQPSPNKTATFQPRTIYLKSQLKIDFHISKIFHIFAVNKKTKKKNYE